MIKVTYVDVEGRFESRVSHLTQRTLANIAHGILMIIVYILHNALPQLIPVSCSVLINSGIEWPAFPPDFSVLAAWTNIIFSVRNFPEQDYFVWLHL